MTAERDDDAMLDMLIATRKAIRLSADWTWDEFASDEEHQLSSIHLIQIIGEAARKVSRERQRVTVEIPWEQIVGMRHRLVHDYFNLKLPLVWTVLKDELPKLFVQLEGIVPPDEEED